MVAAACAPLRAAMGPHWRGQKVSVTATNGNHVSVTLVDWCGSKTKVIDLYWAAMHALGGTGTLRVKISW
jgi:hypothetical protein